MEDWKKSFRFTSAVSRHTDYHLIQPDLVELELVPRTRNLVHSRKSFVETFAILRGYLGFCLFQRGVRDGPCNFPNLDPFLRVFWSPLRERKVESHTFHTIVAKLSFDRSKLGTRAVVGLIKNAILSLGQETGNSFENWIPLNA